MIVILGHCSLHFHSHRRQGFINKIDHFTNLIVCVEFITCLKMSHYLLRLIGALASIFVSIPK